MSVRMVLFDLDGTLLPMDQEVFIKAYFGALVRKLAPYGFDADGLIGSIWAGTKAMIKNDGSRLNLDAFWDVMESIYGKGMRAEREYIFDDFYANDFDREVRASCGFDERSASTVRQIKELGLRVALATNPLFPAVATQSRIRWTGLEPEDFELFTSYENSSYCKPNLDYYREVMESLGVSADECLMVGNDVGDDMVASELGIKVFLLTRDLINPKGVDISIYPHGDYSDLLDYVKTLI